MDTVLRELKAGIRRFRTEIYPENEETYRKAVSEPQRPHALFVTCADSRIDPEMITQSGTGRFVCDAQYREPGAGVWRDVGRRKCGGGICGDCAEGAACGDLRALGLRGDESTDAPGVAGGYAGGEELDEECGCGDERGEVDWRVRMKSRASLMRRLTEENVLLQLQHLRTHPSVAGAMAREELTISGWVYDIGKGEVRISEDGGRVFRPVTTEGGA